VRQLQEEDGHSKTPRRDPARGTYVVGQPDKPNTGSQPSAASATDDRIRKLRAVPQRKSSHQVSREQREPSVPKQYAKKLDISDLRALQGQTADGLFINYNKEQYRHKDPTAPVDKAYQAFAKECNHDIDAFAATTPFNRQQLYDLYTKFKALSKFSLQNRDAARDKHQ